MTSLITSSGHKVSQILKLPYLHQHFSYRVHQKLKISEMLVAIMLVYSTSRKNICRDFRMAAILRYLIQLKFEPRYEKIVPNYAKT